MSRTIKRTKRKSKLSIGFLIIVILSVIFGYFFIKSYDPAYNINITETTHVSIQSGMSTTDIANMLVENGLIKNPTLFKLKSKLLGFDGKYQAGSFDLSASMGMQDIMVSLMDAKRESIRITIPEGYNIKQTVEILSKDLEIDQTSFMQLLANGNFDYRFLEGIPNGENRLEGFLFPDTYDFFVDSTADEIINKMLSKFDAVFEDEYYDRTKELGLSVKELVTIASLIEEETKTAKERPIVSSVVYNRLDIDMKLQFCSTVLYALGEQKSRLLYSDLEIDSPYNTYMYEGLPKGPISSPGKACIEAALYPAETDFLYFVLKGDGSGEHNFAENSTDFNNYKEDYLNTLL